MCLKTTLLMLLGHLKSIGQDKESSTISISRTLSSLALPYPLGVNTQPRNQSGKRKPRLPKLFPLENMSILMMSIQDYWAIRTSSAHSAPFRSSKPIPRDSLRTKRSMEMDFTLSDYSSTQSGDILLLIAAFLSLIIRMLEFSAILIMSSNSRLLWLKRLMPKFLVDMILSKGFNQDKTTWEI